MRLCKEENGQALVLVAMCMAILIGALGLSVDIGLVFRERQNVQIAADAAAQAAALDYRYNQSATSAATQGKAASASNGYSDGVNGVSVTINVPPTSGAVSGTSGYAEAIVTKPTPLSFMGFFGMSSMNVSARSVAGDANTGDGCIWLMNQSANGLQLQGHYDIEAPTCGIYVNSSGTDAVTVTGNGGTVNAKFLDVVGDPTPQHAPSPTAISPNSAPRTPPFQDVSSPNPSSDCSTTSALTSVTSSNVSALSGYSVVCFSQAVTLSNVTLPGSASGVVYLFENGVSLSGTVTFGSGTYDSSSGTYGTTTGAVMDLWSGTLSQGNATLNIYAPTGGTYNGIAIYQPASNTNQLQIQFGSSNETMDGYIVAPGAEVYLQDHGGNATVGGIVADSLFDKASVLTIGNYDQANSKTTPNRQVNLVE